MKYFALLLLLCGCYETSDGSAGTGSCTEQSACCKVCDEADGSKACGDSCIDGDLNCSAGSGCACDVSDVCA